MAWFRCSGGSGGAGSNYTDSAWDGSLNENVYIDKTNGQEVAWTGWAATDYIDIGGQTVIYRGGKISGADYNAWYDSSKAFISGFGNGSMDTVPQNAKYVRYSQSASVMTGKIFTEV